MTGRKHQIRVHLAAIGHPVVGDPRYGPDRKVRNRLALHAKSISFTHPFSGEPLSFDTKVPAYFTALVGHWKPLNLRRKLCPHRAAGLLAQ